MDGNDYFSQYVATDKLKYDGQLTYGPWNMPSFLKTRPKDEQIGAYTVASPYEGRPDLIAQQIYGSPYLYWVLIAFNQARSSLNWPKSGETIYYPVEEIVIPELVS